MLFLWFFQKLKNDEIILEWHPYIMTRHYCCFLNSRIPRICLISKQSLDRHKRTRKKFGPIIHGIQNHLYIALHLITNWADITSRIATCFTEITGMLNSLNYSCCHLRTLTLQHLTLTVKHIFLCISLQLNRWKTASF